MRSFLQDVAECYDIIFPWLNHLSDPQLVGNNFRSHDSIIN